MQLELDVSVNYTCQRWALATNVATKRQSVARCLVAIKVVATSFVHQRLDTFCTYALIRVSKTLLELGNIAIKVYRS